MRRSSLQFPPITSKTVIDVWALQSWENDKRVSLWVERRVLEIKGRWASFLNFPKHPPPPPSSSLPPSVRHSCTDLTLNRKSFERRGLAGGAEVHCYPVRSQESERGSERLGRAWVRYHIPGAPDPKSAPSRLSGTCLCLFTTDGHRRPRQGRRATLHYDQHSHLHLHLHLHLCSSWHLCSGNLTCSTKRWPH